MTADISIHRGYKRYFLIGFAAIIIFASMAYSFYSSSRMISKYSPLIDATMEIKLEATTAHLWFEKLVSGDQYLNFEDIIQHINQAKWYARAMLEGGKSLEDSPRRRANPIEESETSYALPRIQPDRIRLW